MAGARYILRLRDPRGANPRGDGRRRQGGIKTATLMKAEHAVSVDGNFRQESLNV